MVPYLNSSRLKFPTWIFFLSRLSPNNSGDNKSRGEIEVISHLHPKEGVWENQKGVIFHHSRSSSCSHPVSLHLLLPLTLQREGHLFHVEENRPVEILTTGWIFGDYSTRPIRPLNHAPCQPSAPTIRRGHKEKMLLMTDWEMVEPDSEYYIFISLRSRLGERMEFQPRVRWTVIFNIRRDMRRECVMNKSVHGVAYGQAGTFQSALGDRVLKGKKKSFELKILTRQQICR